VSIKVELSEVREVAAGQAPFAYLLTVSADGSAHAVAIDPAIGDGAITLEAGGTSCRNATANEKVSLLWPPATFEDYSLIVDGIATVSGSSISIAPSRAVRHRPAPGGGNDCAPVALKTGDQASPS
jgi:hypothetical protein